MPEHETGISGPSGRDHHIHTEDVEAAYIDMHAVRELTERYRIRAHRMARAQYLASKSTQQMHNRLGIPVVVLSTIVGTSIFASVSTSPALGWVIAAGLISILAATLAALQTFFGFGTRAQQHRVAGAKYSSAKRDLDLLKLSISIGRIRAEDALAKLAEINARLDQIDEESPDVADRFYDQARQEERADDEGL